MELRFIRDDTAWRLLCDCGAVLSKRVPAQSERLICANCGRAWDFVGGEMEMRATVGELPRVNVTLRFDPVWDAGPPG